MTIWRKSRLELGNCGSFRKNDYCQRKMIGYVPAVAFFVLFFFSIKLQQVAHVLINMRNIIAFLKYKY